MLVRRVALAALFLCATMSVAAPAQADQSGLDVAVRATDPLKPVLVLTNRSAESCQVIGGSSLGTVALTRVEQDGNAIEPRPLRVSFPDGLKAGLKERLQTLEPGKSLEVPLLVFKTKDQHMLEMVTWSEASGTFAALFPIAPDKPLTLHVVYAAPLIDGVTTCDLLTASTSADGGGTHTLKWVLAGVGLLLLVVLLIVLLLRRKKSVAAILVLVLLGAVVPGRAARAEYNVDPRLQGAFDDCMALLRQPGNDPAGILDTLDDPGIQVDVIPSVGGPHTGINDPSNPIIFWDPNNRHRYFGTGGNADPCTTLYHEMFHAFQARRGTYSEAMCATPDGRSLIENEIEATRAQNLLRVRLGMEPRSHYEDFPLPEGECQPPPAPEDCEGDDCGDSNGDPHLLTYDGRRYDFQAVGEFVLSRQTTGGYAVQVRQQPIGDSRTVSTNTAVAMSVGPDRVEVLVGPKGLVLMVNGAAVALAPTTLPGGGSVKASAAGISVSWKDGQKVLVQAIGRWGLTIALQPIASQNGKLEGLLGNYDGDPKNDVQSTSFADLYPTYADSWRVEAKASLFTTPMTNVDRTFPEKEPEVLGRALAQAFCQSKGVTDPEILLSCVLDVALTGQADFATAAARGQAFHGGDLIVVRVAKTGDVGTVKFKGTAGQKVFVDVPFTTMASQCDPLQLHAPDKTVLKAGCILNGRGYIDGTVLPVTGEYTITVKPREPSETRLRIVTVVDQVGTLVANGPGVPVRFDKPGVAARFTFTATAGQRIFIDISASTLPSQCGGIDVLGPDNRAVVGGCIVSGGGGVAEQDGFVVPDTGKYTLVIDPNDYGTGEATLRLRVQ